MQDNWWSVGSNFSSLTQKLLVGNRLEDGDKVRYLLKIAMYNEADFLYNEHDHSNNTRYVSMRFFYTMK